MNSIMNENQLTIVKEFELDKPPIQKINSLIDNSIRDCHNKYFHTFDHICENDLNLTNIGNNESVNFTISDKSMGLSELNKKLTLARDAVFLFNQINNFKIKNYSNLFHINIHYYLKFQVPMDQRLFFKKKLNLQT